jgi:hypothetical protein
MDRPLNSAKVNIFLLLFSSADMPHVINVGNKGRSQLFESLNRERERDRQRDRLREKEGETEREGERRRDKQREGETNRER